MNRWELRLRGDYNISEKTKAFFSWNRQDETDLNPNNIWWGTGNDLPYPTQMPANQVSNVYSANVTHIFSPTLTNEVVFADATFLNPIALSNPAAVDPTKLGFSLTGLFKDPYAPQIPNTLSWSKAVPGYFAPTFGQAFNGGDFGKLSQTPNISDNLTKVAGTHLLKFGFYWDFARNDQAASNFQYANQGTVEFETYAHNTTSNGAADFATGRLAGFFQASAAPVQDVKFYQYAFYANDQWKISRRLTLTLGIRADHLGNWINNANNLGFAVWNPAAYNNSPNAPGWTGLQWHAIDSNIPLSGLPTKAFFPEPRIGVAYDLRSGTARQSCAADSESTGIRDRRTIWAAQTTTRLSMSKPCRPRGTPAALATTPSRSSRRHWERPAWVEAPMVWIRQGDSQRAVRHDV